MSIRANWTVWCDGELEIDPRAGRCAQYHEKGAYAATKEEARMAAVEDEWVVTQRKVFCPAHVKHELAKRLGKRRK